MLIRHEPIFSLIIHYYVAFHPHNHSLLFFFFENEQFTTSSFQSLELTMTF